MRQEYPFVSIVIPVYNGSNYLQAAIDCALSQTYPNVEVIVVNDGSRDDGATESIAQSYGEKIRYFEKVNGGVATALNRGIQEMRGEYFSWLSHDDLYTPDKIEKQVDALLQTQNRTSIVFSEYDQLDVDSGRVTPIRDSLSYSTEQLTNSVFPVVNNLIHGCSLLIHRTHFERVGTFDEKLITTQDYDLWFRMFRHQRLILVPEALVISRVHEEQGSRTLPQHERERSELYIHFMNELTEAEMASMYGSPYFFFYQMRNYCLETGLEPAARYAEHNFQSAVVPDDLDEKLTQFKNQIEQLSNGKARKIGIFGAGNYGLQLLQDLKVRRLQVDFFFDNNPSKWGLAINQVPCIEPATLGECKDQVLVIVAARMPETMVKQMSIKGYPHVYTKQQLDSEWLRTPPDHRLVPAIDGGR
ncbi:glycosyltransferase [Cohnella endophytica]|uniref:Glycosyltransferase n=1 Tax=Cohnella endophytica TaxID=2419778 RepID=A0A494XC98_9BACL|nr:glycosyltransferase [Cohnella endophytica]RKP47241.1 glycosyltransferase [Cohnella endophytica]